MRHSVQYFSHREFICKCCGRGHPAVALVWFLDTFRGAWGAPVLVNSAYRCAAHNAEVGGVSNSRHLLGCAADIKPADSALLPAFKNLVQHMLQGRSDWELKLYPTFVHVAVPRDEWTHIWLGGSVVKIDFS